MVVAFIFIFIFMIERVSILLFDFYFFSSTFFQGQPKKKKKEMSLTPHNSISLPHFIVHFTQYLSEQYLQLHLLRLSLDEEELLFSQNNHHPKRYTVLVSFIQKTNNNNNNENIFHTIKIKCDSHKNHFNLKVCLLLQRLFCLYCLFHHQNNNHHNNKILEMLLYPIFPNKSWNFFLDGILQSQIYNSVLNFSIPIENKKNEINNNNENENGAAFPTSQEENNNHYENNNNHIKLECSGALILNANIIFNNNNNNNNNNESILLFLHAPQKTLLTNRYCAMKDENKNINENVSYLLLFEFMKQFTTHFIIPFLNFNMIKCKINKENNNNKESGLDSLGTSYTFTFQNNNNNKNNNTIKNIVLVLDLPLSTWLYLYQNNNNNHKENIKLMNQIGKEIAHFFIQHVLHQSVEKNIDVYSFQNNNNNNNNCYSLEMLSMNMAESILNIIKRSNRVSFKEEAKKLILLNHNSENNNNNNEAQLSVLLREKINKCFTA